MTWDSVFSSVPAVVMVGGVFLWVMRSVVRDEIAKLDDRYLRKELATQKFEEIEKHFDYLRDRAKSAHGD